MTLTTDREEFEQWAELACELPWGFLAKRRKDSGEYADSTYEDMWKAWVAGREALANREAQPVALVDRRPAASGGICWQHGGKDLPHGTELFTVPPASAVPGEAKLGEMPFLGKSERGYVRGWNDCRAAMLKGERP
ncbi:hypothetical protein [Serratia ureilytica]|uniref:hypothetical protein n=1 Tax=Serratia ureilytica TaxID=300181 RepID=UPI00313D8843